MENLTFYIVFESNSIDPKLSKIREGGFSFGGEVFYDFSLFLFPTQKEEDGFILDGNVSRVEIQDLEGVHEKIVRWLRVMFREVGRWYRSGITKEITHITGEEFILYPKEGGIERLLVRIVRLGNFIGRAIQENEKVYFVKVPPGTTMDAMLEV